MTPPSSTDVDCQYLTKIVRTHGDRLGSAPSDLGRGTRRSPPGAVNPGNTHADSDGRLSDPFYPRLSALLDFPPTPYPGVAPCALPTIVS